MYSNKNREDVKDLDELADLQSIVKQVRLIGMLGKQGYHYDVTELFEPITKAVTDSNHKLLEETKSTTKAIEELDETNVHVKVLDFLNKNWVTHSSLTRPIAKLLAPTEENQYRFYDDPDCDIWNDYIMEGEKVTIYNENLVLKKSEEVFNLIGGALKMITD